jgi:ABC-type dipeptide/oligopeptide/nickel transport system permease subunit
MWAASIATAAGAHTLDVWRYLIPAVPMVGLMLSLFVIELADQTRDALRPQKRPSNPLLWP